MMDVMTAGCAECRYFWAGRQPPPRIGVSLGLHASLFRCPVCGTFWEEYERYASPVTEAQAQGHFPEVFRDCPT